MVASRLSLQCFRLILLDHCFFFRYGFFYRQYFIIFFLNINLLKGALTLEQSCQLISYINGDLTDESDDLIDDTLLYFYFVRLAARAQDLGDKDIWDAALKEVTAGYREPIPGAGEKLEKVLKVMLTAWLAGRLKAQAEQMLGELTIKKGE